MQIDAYQSGALDFGSKILDFSQEGVSIISEPEVIEDKGVSELWYKN